MAEAYIVQAVRTAGGRRGGRLAGWHPADMAGATLDAIVGRSGIDPAAIEDVIMGCVSQGGEQSFQVGRGAVLASSLPTSVPAVTIDRQCGSSQQAIQFAAQAVMSGTQDVVIAAGVESMTRVPMGSTYKLFYDAGLGKNKSPGLEEKFPGIVFNQFAGAEMIAKKYGFTRETLDDFSLSSHRKAVAANFGGTVLVCALVRVGVEINISSHENIVSNFADLEVLDVIAITANIMVGICHCNAGSNERGKGNNEVLHQWVLLCLSQ